MPLTTHGLPASGSTATYTFSFTSTQAAPTLRVGGTVPQFEIMYASGAADAKRWNWAATANAITFRTLNDAGNTGVNIFQVFRSGTAVSLFALEAPSLVVVPANGTKLWLAKYNSGSAHNNAPTTFDASANYLQIGGREYGNNGYSGIGFGYVGVTTDHPCVMIGHEEKATAGSTSGDFLIATRPTTANVAPTIRLRVTSAGQICSEGFGTVTAPAISFTGDSDTGLFAPGADILALVVGGAEKFRVSSTGPTFTGNLLPTSAVAQNIGAPNSEILHVYVSSVIQAPSVISSNGSFTDTDPDEVFMDATTGNLSAQVTMGSTSIGKRFLFKKIDASANTVTVNLSAGTIDGAANVVLTAHWQWVEIRIINATTAYIVGKG